MSVYLSEKWSDYDEIWYTKSHTVTIDKNAFTKIQIASCFWRTGQRIRRIVDFRDILQEVAWSELWRANVKFF